VTLAGGVTAGQGVAGVASTIFFGCAIWSLGQQGALGHGEFGCLPEGAGGAGEGAEGEQVHLVGDLGPGGAGRGIGDADEQQGEPAQDDVGLDAFFLAVVDRAQVDDLLEVAPAALGFAELLSARLVALSVPESLMSSSSWPRH
jgi:hypothetical protein